MSDLAMQVAIDNMAPLLLPHQAKDKMRYSMKEKI